MMPPIRKLKAALHRSGNALTRRLLSRPTVAEMAIEQVVLGRFFESRVGQAYGVTADDKKKMVASFQRTTTAVPSGTEWLYHVVLATEILSIPPSTPGDVIECGCWKGASTSNLSIACARAGRRLIVADSFQGLPDDDPGVTHDYPHVGVYGYYAKGMYAGRQEEVAENIRRHGDITSCHFMPGFFSETLKDLRGPIAFAFLDVDLASSMRDCVRHIWPRLEDGGFVYTDDSCDMEVVRVWFDDEWWRSEVGCRAPGYVGSGCGLPLHTTFSALGYARKVSDPAATYRTVSWLRYPGPAQAEK